MLLSAVPRAAPHAAKVNINAMKQADQKSRLIFLAATLVIGLILANIAASLLAVWQLDPGAAVPGPWSALFDAARANSRSNFWSVLGAGFFGGAALACLVFALQRALQLLLGSLSGSTR